MYYERKLASLTALALTVGACGPISDDPLLSNLAERRWDRSPCKSDGAIFWNDDPQYGRTYDPRPANASIEGFWFTSPTTEFSDQFPEMTPVRTVLQIQTRSAFFTPWTDYAVVIRQETTDETRGEFIVRASIATRCGSHAGTGTEILWAHSEHCPAIDAVFRDLQQTSRIGIGSLGKFDIDDFQDSVMSFDPSSTRIIGNASFGIEYNFAQSEFDITVTDGSPLYDIAFSLDERLGNCWTITPPPDVKAESADRPMAWKNRLNTIAADNIWQGAKTTKVLETAPDPTDSTK